VLGSTTKKILFLSVFTLGILISPSESKAKEEIIFSYESGDGEYIKVTTGEGAEEAALERYFLDGDDAHLPETQNELELIKSLGGFVKYEEYLNTATAEDLAYAFAQYGLSVGTSTEANETALGPDHSIDPKSKVSTKSRRAVDACTVKYNISEVPNNTYSFLIDGEQENRIRIYNGRVQEASAAVRGYRLSLIHISEPTRPY